MFVLVREDKSQKMSIEEEHEESDQEVVAEPVEPVPKIAAVIH